MLTKSYRFVLGYGMIVGLSVLFLLFFVASSAIGNEVKNQCQKAINEYGEDCTLALSQMVNDQRKDFRSRNDAIWALGQLGDPRALGALESHYTGVIPEKEPLHASLSQYELKKAINMLRSGTNITSVFWRHGIQ